MRRFAALLLLSWCAAPAVSAGENETAATRAIASAAADWLWRQQAGPDASENGGWPSRTYGLLKSGQAYTPFVLNTLLRLPEDVAPRPAGAVDRGLDFVRRHLNDDGVLGVSDPDILEYPNYATSDALRLLVQHGDPDDAERIRRMTHHLLAQQFNEQSGFQPDHPAYGSWGFGGPRSPATPGHVDLAHTRRVLEALAFAHIDDPETFRRAETFLHLVQKHPAAIAEQPAITPFNQDEILPVPFDGGFYFSPVVLTANKGREDTSGLRPYFRSYASATCDGVLALLAAGVSPNDPRVTAAAGWLEQHPRLDEPEGIPADYPEPWGKAIRYYHLAVRASVYRRLDWPGEWRAEIVGLLGEWQRDDGSFVNMESHLMKEDDPLLATTLALSALAECLLD